MKLITVCTRTIIVGAIFLGVSVSLSARQAIQNRAGPPTLEAMEQHWQSVIKERDTAQRQVLIEEHRRMMSEVQKAEKGKVTTTQTSTMMQDSVHRDLIHTIEMHSIMMEMMK